MQNIENEKIIDADFSQTNKKINKYHLSWWKPFVYGMISLILMLICNFTTIFPIFFPFFFMGLNYILLLGIFIVFIVQLFKRMWLYAFINLGFLFLYFIVLSMSFAFIFFLGMNSQKKDDFGKDIIIPKNIEIEIPKPEMKKDYSGLNSTKESSTGITMDPEGYELRKVFTNTNNNNVKHSFDMDLTFLNDFVGENKNLLIQYLSNSPKWRVMYNNGELEVYRRFVFGDEWQSSLNGFYTSSNFNYNNDKRFQFRIKIYFKKPKKSIFGNGINTYVDVNDKKINLNVKEDKNNGQGIESELILESEGLTIEIFEQSQSFDRSFTELVLKQLKNEFGDLLNKEKQELMLKSGISINHNVPDIQLRNEFQGGIYQATAYVNPGEAGYVYLKAYEATKNTPLSETSLKKSSTEKVGYSNNQGDMFLYNSYFNIFEGDWGTYYPARLELWFEPDSGGPEKKLIEKIFKIEGWQR